MLDVEMDVVYGKWGDEWLLQFDAPSNEELTKISRLITDRMDGLPKENPELERIRRSVEANLLLWMEDEINRQTFKAIVRFDYVIFGRKNEKNGLNNEQRIQRR